MTEARRGEISPSQLFSVIFVSRLVVCLTNIQSVTVGKLSFDLLVAFLASGLLTLLLSVPALICIKRNKNPLDNKALALLYGLYYTMSCAITISRFSYFATARMNPKVSMAVFIIVGFAAVCYGAYLGIEPLGRFSSFCGIILVIAVLIVIMCNLKSFNELNLYPLVQNTTKNDAFNMLLFTGNTIEPALLLCLSNKINGDITKPFVFGIIGSFLLIFVILFFSICILGGNANLQAFPVYSFFQMASAFDKARLDMLHTAFWIMALFLKGSVLIYCASLCIKKYTHKAKTIAISVAGVLISLFINLVVGTKMVSTSKPIIIGTFAFFIVVVPVLYLIFGGKKCEKFSL